MGTKVLLLGAGTQGLAMAVALKRAGCQVSLLYGEKHNYGDKTRRLERKFFFPYPTMAKEYLDKVFEIVENKNVDAVLPMGDVTAEFVSKNKAELQAITNVSCPEYDVFMQGYDKNQLMALCREKGYPHPLTVDLSKVECLDSDELKRFPYPAMLKPNCTTGGRGMVAVNSHAEFVEKYPALHSEYGDYHLQRFVKPGGKQVKIQLCVDADGTLVAHSAMQKLRWYPVKAGSNCCAVSIEETKMTEICHQILKDLKWEGFADFDLIEDPDTGELLVMEINPRVPACIGAAINAGVDWGRILVDHALGNPQKEYTCRPGVILRHLGFDVLWFMKSPNRWKAKPSWFKLFGKNVHYQDMSGWSDPMPFLAGTFHNIKKLMSPSFRESKTV